MLFLGFVVTALIPPITTSTTAFPPHILSGSSFSLCYFSSFSSSFLLMLLSLGIATCTTTAFTVTTSLPSYRSASESSTGSQLHLSQSPLKVFSALILETLAHTWHRCLCAMPATRLWRSKCALPASILRPAVLHGLRSIFAQSGPWVLSGVVDPSLCLSCVQDCSCAAMISASVLYQWSALSSHW